jgi:hypothetical protein
LISKIFEKEIFFESSVLAWTRIRIRIRTRIELKSWIRIRIRIESIRIHNPAFFLFETKLQDIWLKEVMKAVVTIHLLENIFQRDLPAPEFWPLVGCASKD